MVKVVISDNKNLRKSYDNLRFITMHKKLVRLCNSVIFDYLKDGRICTQNLGNPNLGKFDENLIF